MPEPHYSVIFIVGSPRSGKTLLQNILGFHDKLAWLSQYNSKLHMIPFVGVLNNLYNIPLLGDFLLKYSDSRYLPHPEEISKKYVSIMKNYGSLTHQDVTKKDCLKLKSVIEKQLFYQKKNMIVADCGRPARLLYYEKIFPGTKFIHVVRDGRDVVFESLRDRPKWFTEEKDLKDFYPNAPQRLINLGSRYKNTEHYKMVLAALHWKMAIMEIKKQSASLKNKVFTLRYEDLKMHPTLYVTKVLTFLDLKMTNRIKSIIENKNLHLPRNKKREFNKYEESLLFKLLKKELIQFNYTE